MASTNFLGVAAYARDSVTASKSQTFEHGDDHCESLLQNAPRTTPPDEHERIRALQNLARGIPFVIREIRVIRGSV
jgi:hypothetical protein